jgi:predicted nucleotidyltransferase
MQDSELILNTLLDACKEHYGERLVSLAVFGSFGRGTPRLDSDVDLLVVAEPLPRGRISRVKEFGAVERMFRARPPAAARTGGTARRELSPVIKTREEAGMGSPLFLDMVDDARILFDRDGFFAGTLARLNDRLKILGSKRIWKGSAWYWDLKPDYKPGEVFEL